MNEHIIAVYFNPVDEGLDEGPDLLLCSRINELTEGADGVKGRFLTVILFGTGIELSLQAVAPLGERFELLPEFLRVKISLSIEVEEAGALGVEFLDLGGDDLPPVILRRIVRLLQS